MKYLIRPIVLRLFNLGDAADSMPAEDPAYFHFHDYTRPAREILPRQRKLRLRRKNSAASPTMRVETDIRPPTGLGSNITLYGGATAFQNGTLKITSPAAPGAEIRGSIQSSAGGVGGLKIGYTWPGFGSMGGDPASSSPELVEPSLAGDFFWSGYRYKAAGSGTTSSSGITGNYDGTLTADVNAFTFCVEPTVKFNLGAFRPYAGLGVGGTYVEASHAHVDGNVGIVGLGSASGGRDLTGSSNDLAFSAEAIAGAEFFLNKNWAPDV